MVTMTPMATMVWLYFDFIMVFKVLLAGSKFD